MLRLRRTAPTGGNRQYGRYGYRPYPGIQGRQCIPSMALSISGGIIRRVLSDGREVQTLAFTPLPELRPMPRNWLRG